MPSRPPTPSPPIPSPSAGDIHPPPRLLSLHRPKMEPVRRLSEIRDSHSAYAPLHLIVTRFELGRDGGVGGFLLPHNRAPREVPPCVSSRATTQPCGGWDLTPLFRSARGGSRRRLGCSDSMEPFQVPFPFPSRFPFHLCHRPSSDPALRIRSGSLRRHWVWGFPFSETCTVADA